MTTENTENVEPAEIGCHERIAGALLDFVSMLEKDVITADFRAELESWAMDYGLTLDDAWTNGRWTQETFRHALVMDPNTTREQLHYWLCEAREDD